MFHVVIIDKEAKRSFWEEYSDERVKVIVCSCAADLPCCDAVLISDELSGIDALSALSKVRSMEGFRTVPAAAVTSDGSEEHQKLLLYGGFDDVMRMPVCKELFARRIEGLSNILPYHLTTTGFSFECLMDIRDDGRDGAYSVQSGDFANIYKFVLRVLQRLKKSAQVLVLTLDSGNNVEDNNKKVMHTLSDDVRMCLRRGDMATVFSEKQIVVLLIGADDNGGHLVANRIVSSFYSECSDDSYHLDYDIREVVSK